MAAGQDVAERVSKAPDNVVRDNAEQDGVVRDYEEPVSVASVSKAPDNEVSGSGDSDDAALDSEVSGNVVSVREALVSAALVAIDSARGDSDSFVITVSGVAGLVVDSRLRDLVGEDSVSAGNLSA